MRKIALVCQALPPEQLHPAGDVPVRRCAEIHLHRVDVEQVLVLEMRVAERNAAARAGG